MNLPNINDFLLNRFPGGGRVARFREALVGVCELFVAKGLADPKFVKELCSGKEPQFWSCISEALLADRMARHGIEPLSSGGRGPDFLVMDGERKIWIEVICPEPRGLPEGWLKPKSQKVEVFSFPHGSIILRWMSAIKEKAEKLLGPESAPEEGYLSKGIVGIDDAYVIAINGCQLHRPGFTGLNGISDFPFVVEAVFAVGPYQVFIDRETLTQTGADYQHRPMVQKPNGSMVPAYTFLDPRFEPISAIWAVDMDGSAAIGNWEPMVVVHNPNAKNPIPTGLLPAQYEYVGMRISEEEFQLEKQRGRLHQEEASELGEV